MKKYAYKKMAVLVFSVFALTNSLFSKSLGSWKLRSDVPYPITVMLTPPEHPGKTVQFTLEPRGERTIPNTTSFTFMRGPAHPDYSYNCAAYNNNRGFFTSGKDHFVVYESASDQKQGKLVITGAPYNYKMPSSQEAATQNQKRGWGYSQKFITGHDAEPAGGSRSGGYNSRGYGAHAPPQHA